METASGHEAVTLDEESMQRQNQHWGRYADGLVKLFPGEWFFPVKYTNFADKIYNFKYRNNDVIVMSYPKCGSTWVQEIVWTMKNNPSLDHPLAHEDVLARSPFLDFDIIRPSPKSNLQLPGDTMKKIFTDNLHGKDESEGINLPLAEACPDPRIIKTHMSFSLLRPSMLDTAKVVFVARNPKDVIISYYHHSRIAPILDYTGSFEGFVQYFLDGEILYGHYWLHLKEAWERKDHRNMHFIFYEDLKSKTMEELKKLNDFLGTNLTERQLEGIAKYTSFQNMKAREAKRVAESPKGYVDLTPTEEARKLQRQTIIEKEGGFYRKGEIGDWKKTFTHDLESRVDQWISDNISSFGLSFRFSS